MYPLYLSIVPFFMQLSISGVQSLVIRGLERHCAH